MFRAIAAPVAVDGRCVLNQFLALFAFAVKNTQRVFFVPLLAQFAKRMQERAEPQVTPPQDALEALRLGYYLGFRKGYLFGLEDGATVATMAMNQPEDSTRLVVAP